MNGYVYLNRKYSDPLFSLHTSESQSATIDGIYNAILDIYHTGKALFASGEVLATNGQYVGYRIFISISKEESETIYISFFFENMTFLFTITKNNVVTKIGG